MFVLLQNVFCGVSTVGRARQQERRKWKSIQMAAVVDLSWPFDRCSTGIYDLRSGRSKMSGTVADMASVFTSTHRKREGGILKTYKLWKISD